MADAHDAAAVATALREFTELRQQLAAAHELLEDRGMCPYFRRDEPGQDPKGICGSGCVSEPSCQTDHDGPWGSEAVREVLGYLDEVIALWSPPPGVVARG